METVSQLEPQEPDRAWQPEARVSRPDAAAGAAAGFERRLEALEERERRLDAREREFEETAAQLVVDHEHVVEEAVQNVHALTAQVADRERALAAREAEHARSLEVDGAELDRRRRRLAAQEEELSERTHELTRLERLLEEREEQLAEREARARVEFELKEEELEGREREVVDQAGRLERKAQDLTRYVGQLQGRLTVAG